MKTFKIFKNTISVFILAGLFFVSGCDDNVLDRPELNKAMDESYWTSEGNVRLYTNEFYHQFFVGYGATWSVDYVPLRGFVFSDDVIKVNKQDLFETSVPTARGSNNLPSSAPVWMTTYAGPTWYFGWIRKANLMINRIENRMGDILTSEAKAHWTAVARFFRSVDYCRLVSVFGDVPYYDRLLETTDTEELYKDRTPRNEVMDKVYDDFKAILNDLRENDGDQTLNRDIAAAFISRWMLFEGTWQKYQEGDNTRAKKFLYFAVEASEIIMSQTSKYEIQTDFRTLFGSENLAGNKECIMYRHYDATQVTHHIASYSNLTETPGYGPNLALVKSFICNDGEVWQNSSLSNTNQFDISNLVKTRDSRFEASFWDKPREQSPTLLYPVKFIDRVGPTYAGGSYPAKYTSFTNTNDAPVVRLGEILLNWIEAKAELATMGGSAVSQSDIDKSINALRDRPLAPEAEAKGVVKTSHLQLSSLPNDPARDADVSALIWEIRRERRMELFFEYSRLLDLKRWKKINYMKGSLNPDMLKGIWVNLPVELPEALVEAKKGETHIMKEDGTIVYFNGTNHADMVGYFLPKEVEDRDDFNDRVYLAPVGKDQIDLYQSQGYTLSQTKNW